MRCNDGPYQFSLPDFQRSQAGQDPALPQSKDATLEKQLAPLHCQHCSESMRKTWEMTVHQRRNGKSLGKSNPISTLNVEKTWTRVCSSSVPPPTSSDLASQQWGLLPSRHTWLQNGYMAKLHGFQKINRLQVGLSSWHSPYQTINLQDYSSALCPPFVWQRCNLSCFGLKMFSNSWKKST